MKKPTDNNSKHPQAIIAEKTDGLMSQIAADVRKSKVGRKTKRSPELVNDLLIYLRAGLSLEDAGRHVGVCNETIHNWKRDDPELHSQIEQARDDGMETLEATIINIMSGGSLSTGDVKRDAELVKQLRWIMSKRNTRYADKVDITSGGKSLTIVNSIHDAALFSPIEAEFVEVNAIEDQTDD